MLKYYHIAQLKKCSKFGLKDFFIKAQRVAVKKIKT